MIIKYIVAGSMLSGITALVAWLQIIDRRERERRSRLPPEEQKKLADEEDAWSQGHSF